ncbi:MAG: OB-fold nucleic acid binding domain-containing protein, partial [Candidatus Woesearchaeota archaeon]
MKSFSKRINSLEIQKQKIGSSVVISGFVERIKLLGKMAFLSVRDSSGYTQVVVNDKNLIKKIEEVTRESVLRL